MSTNTSTTSHTTTDTTPNAKPAKHEHQFLKVVLRIMVGFLILCVVLELGLRPFGYGHYTIYRPDQRLLWVPEPGRTLTVVNHLPITINHQGLRYASDLQPKQADQFRIITFGDSFAQGWGVDDNSHFSALLEKKLNQGPCTKEHFQSISGGVNAYPNSLAAEKLKQVVEDDTLRPDVAIFAYAENSNLEKLTQLQGEDRARFLRRVEWKSIARRSAIYNFFIEDLLRQIAYYQLRHIIMAGTLEGDAGMHNLDMNQFNQNLADSLQICRKHNVQMVFLMPAGVGEDSNTPLHPFQKAMLDFALREHVPMVNMIPVMSPLNQSAMFMDQVHPTVAGNDVIADELLKTVETLPNYNAVCNGSSVADLKGVQPVAPAATPVASR
jgi:lysophospholipase L1-like esterase